MVPVTLMIPDSFLGQFLTSLNAVTSHGSSTKQIIQVSSGAAKSKKSSTTSPSKKVIINQRPEVVRGRHPPRHSKNRTYYIERPTLFGGKTPSKLLIASRRALKRTGPKRHLAIGTTTDHGLPSPSLLFLAASQPTHHVSHVKYFTANGENLTPSTLHLASKRAHKEAIRSHLYNGLTASQLSIAADRHKLRKANLKKFMSNKLRQTPSQLFDLTVKADIKGPSQRSQKRERSSHQKVAQHRSIQYFTADGQNLTPSILFLATRQVHKEEARSHLLNGLTASQLLTVSERNHLRRANYRKYMSSRLYPTSSQLFDLSTEKTSNRTKAAKRPSASKATNKGVVTTVSKHLQPSASLLLLKHLSSIEKQVLRSNKVTPKSSNYWGANRAIDELNKGLTASQLFFVVQKKVSKPVTAKSHSKSSPSTATTTTRRGDLLLEPLLYGF